MLTLGAQDGIYPVIVVCAPVPTSSTMSKHAPRGPRLKKKADPLADVDPLATPPCGLGKGVRCTAHSKRHGGPCPQPAMAGGFVCHMHGGKAPQVQLTAKERLKALQPKAVQTLEDLLDADSFPTVQLGAAKDILDRTDGKAGETINITVTATIVNARLLAARKRLVLPAANQQNP